MVSSGKLTWKETKEFKEVTLLVWVKRFWPKEFAVVSAKLNYCLPIGSKNVGSDAVLRI